MKYLLGIFFWLLVGNCYAEPLAAKYFAKKPSYGSVKLSPDGKHLAVTVPAEDRSVLVILDRKTQEAVSVFQPNSREFIDRYEWASNERVVYSHYVQEEGFEQRSYFGNILAADIDGHRQSVIFGIGMQTRQVGTLINKKRDNIRAWGHIGHNLPKDPNNILIMSQHYGSKPDAGYVVYKVNFQNGNRSQVTTTPVGNMSYVFDEIGETLFVAGRNRQGDFEGHVYKDGEWTETKKSSKLANLTPISVSSDGNTVYLKAYKDGKTLSLYRYKVATDELTLEFQDPVADIFDEIQEPVTNRVIGVKTMPGLVQTHYFDETDKFTQLHKSLSDAFSGQDVTITSETEDGNWLVVLVRNDRNPGDFYLFDTVKKDVSYMMSRREWLDPDKMATRQPFHFESKQGHQLHGYITWPEKTDKPVPLVTLAHGGPFGVKDNWFFDEDAQMLANNGFAVLQVNFRGSSGYGLEFEESAHRKSSTLIQQDIVEATQWAMANEKISDDKVCIMGTSFGGTAAVMAPITAPGLFSCSVAIAGVYDNFEQERTADYSKNATLAVQARKIYGDDEAELKKNSALTYIDKFNIPIFIAHGGEDKRVLPEQSFILKNALEKRKVPIEWHYKETEGHGFYGEANKEELYTKVVTFLNKYLK